MRILAILALALSTFLCWGSVSPAIAVSRQASTFESLDANHDGQLEASELPAERVTLFHRLLRTSDADENGTLSLDEFTDGLAVRREQKPQVEKPPKRLPGADELLLLLALIDTNADGVVTPGEPPKRLQAFYQELKKFIANPDQAKLKLEKRRVGQRAPQLTRVALRTVKQLGIDVDLELALLPEPNWRLVQRLEESPLPVDSKTGIYNKFETLLRLDTNGDGTVDSAEVPSELVERFQLLLAAADEDSDEMLNWEELDLYLERLHRPSAPPATKAKKRDSKQPGKKKAAKQDKPKKPPVKKASPPASPVQEKSSSGE